MTREEAATQRIETLEARLAGKEHHHVTGEFCVACGIEEGKRVDLLETANKRVGSILLRGLLLANRAGLDVIDKYIAASALGLLMQGRLSSEVSPETKAEVAFEKLIKDHDVEIAQLRARVEQLVKDTPPAAQLERWKKLEEDNARLQRLLSWTQGCVVRAACALAVVLRDETFDGANLATTAHGVAQGLMDVDAAITTGEPTRAEEVPS